MSYRNPALPIEARIDDLLTQMTVDEKIGQLMQLPGECAWLGVDLVEWTKAGKVGSILSVVGDQVRPYQDAALASRLGIPLLVGIDAIHGHSMWHHATMFPSQLALSNSWDEDLCHQVARATAVEVAYTGIHWTFSPVLCLPRDLRWGRTGESFGEDPLLIARLAVAMIRGYQGDDLSHPTSIAACAKHFAGYGESDGGRDASESGHSWRTMQMVYLPPFQAAAAAGCATYMTAYHAIDGVPAAFDRRLLTDTLKTAWKFDGVIVTDWDIVGRMHRDRKICATSADGSARALIAGNDLIMTTPGFFADTQENLKNGRVTMTQVDEACRRMLRLKFRLGLFEHPRQSDEAKARLVSGTPEHRALALESARKSLVLLKNRGVLPLDRTTVKRLAVIGPNSDDVLGQLGDWSLAAGQKQGQRDAYTTGSTTTVLAGLRRLLGDVVEVVHGVGCGMEGNRMSWPGPTWATSRTGDGAHEAQPEKIARAVRLAESADAVVLVLGDHVHSFIGESKSTATLDLPGEQQALFDAVIATGTPVIVVFIGSKPLAIPDVARRCDAFLCAYNPGMAGGTAIAEALFGLINPCGKLTISWPHHIGQCPVRYDQSIGAHQAGYPDLPDVGYDPVFAFGFGLSYTTIRYRELTLAKKMISPGDPIQATVRLQNTGNTAVEEIVQVYLNDAFTSVVWAAKKLKDWQRVALAPGEERTVTFTIPHQALALCDAAGRWVVEPGDFTLLVGGSSRDQDLLKAGFTVG